VKKNLKSVHIYRCYRQNNQGSVFWNTRYTIPYNNALFVMTHGVMVRCYPTVCAQLTVSRKSKLGWWVWWFSAISRLCIINSSRYISKYHSVSILGIELWPGPSVGMFVRKVYCGKRLTGFGCRLGWRLGSVDSTQGMGVLDGRPCALRERGGFGGLSPHWFEWRILWTGICIRPSLVRGKVTLFPYGQYIVGIDGSLQWCSQGTLFKAEAGAKAAVVSRLTSRQKQGRN